MTKLENRCASCGGKFGLVCHHYWRLRFCCKACKTSFLRKRRSALVRARASSIKGRRSIGLAGGFLCS
jgi:hypothetical protein